MKFGRLFESYKIPEWYEYYYDYKGIKIVLKFMDNRTIKRRKLKKLKMIKMKYEKKYKYNQGNEKLKRSMSTIINQSLEASPIIVNPKKSKKLKIKIKRILEAEDLTNLPNDQKISRFINIYKDKIKHIDQFFNDKLKEFTEELNQIQNKMYLMDDSSENFSIGDINIEANEIGYAVSWKRALSSFYNNTYWLHSYLSINSLAVLKIKKKAIKIFNIYDLNISEDLEKVSSEFLFFGNSLNKLVDLRVRIKKLYSKKFNKGNDNQAKIELEKRLQGGIDKGKSRLLFLYLGILITLIFFYVVFKHIDGENTNDSFKPFFPFFNFAYIMILCLLFTGINITILKYYKINYRYLFELDPKNKINPYGIFETVAGLSALWMFFF